MTNEREVADVADAFLRRRSGIRHHVGVALLPDWLRRIAPPGTPQAEVDDVARRWQARLERDWQAAEQRDDA